MPVSFEAMWYSSIFSEQKYTEYTETENLIELFMSNVKQEYTEYTATENLVAICLQYTLRTLGGYQSQRFHNLFGGGCKPTADLVIKQLTC